MRRWMAETCFRWSIINIMVALYGMYDHGTGIGSALMALGLASWACWSVERHGVLED